MDSKARIAKALSLCTDTKVFEMGQGIAGMGDMYAFTEEMSPLGNASAEECADYIVTLFSDLTRKVTMQNLYHDGGYSSMGISASVIEAFKNGKM